nr:hypothetical protein [Raoultella ornithinolytica]
MSRMKVKDLVSAANTAAACLPPAEASLMRAIASRLDVTFVALTEALDQNKALKAELEPPRGGH